MKTLSKSQFFTVALTLFSLFFGAGNFIFPPTVGANSGENFFTAIMFFNLAAVAIPVLGVAAVAKAGSLRVLAGRADVYTGLIFTSAAYIALGPLLAIPRAGSMPFDISIAPFLPEQIRFEVLVCYAILYFILNAYLCLSQTRLLAIIGRYLTPVMLLLIVVLFLVGVSGLPIKFNEPNEAYLLSPAASGFVDGYQTMDALAALIFATLITGAISHAGVSERGAVVTSTVRAGIVAGIVLMSVYFMLGFLGALSGQNSLSSTQLLVHISSSIFGIGGQIVLGVTFFLACFGTTTGLTSAVSGFFHSLFPGVSYRTWVFIFSAQSAIVACNGLSKILLVSVPILVALYPIAIVLIVLSLIDELISSSRAVYKSCVYVSGAIGISSGLDMAGFLPAWLKGLLLNLPFYELWLGWIVPVAISFALSYLYSMIFERDARY